MIEAVHGYAPRLRAIAQARGLSAIDAEDVVHEAFARFIELAPRLATIDEARAFLATVVMNLARNARRRHHRKKPHVAMAPIEDPSPLPDQQLDTEQTLAKLRSCIATLEEIPRRVVSLRVIQELSGSEVAKSVDLVPGHVAVVLHRAKKDLCRCMLS